MIVTQYSYSAISNIDNETLRFTVNLSNNIYFCAKEEPECEVSFEYKTNKYDFKTYRHEVKIKDEQQYQQQYLKLILNALEMYKGIFPSSFAGFQYSFSKKYSDNQSLSLPESLNDTAVMFSYNKAANIAFIVFRGNSSLANTFTVLDIRMTNFLNTEAQVHKGIYDYLTTALNSKIMNDEKSESLENKIIEAVNNNAKFIITGHSLGAAIVPIMGAYLNVKYNVSPDNIFMVAYSAPAVYDYNFIRLFESKLTNYIIFHNIGDPNSKYSIIGDPISWLTTPLKLHSFGYKVIISNTDDPNPALPIPDDSPDWLKYLLSLHSILDYKNYVLENFRD